MTRDEAGKAILNIGCNKILAELPTSFGKSKIALLKMGQRVSISSNTHILIVIPRLVLIDNWKDEFTKWGYSRYLPYVKFITYVSFSREFEELSKTIWDMVIFDEVHHLSDKCIEALRAFKHTFKEVLLLSATVKKEIKMKLVFVFAPLYIFRISTKAAIQESILPDPRVYLIPLYLDTKERNYEIIKNKNASNPITIEYNDRFSYSKVKNRKIIIKCTQQEYYNDMTSLINWYKNRVFSEVFKNLFLRKSGERLKWLSNIKTDFIKGIEKTLIKERTLTFCNSIEQTELLGKYCVNSKNKESQSILEAFNTNKINHITACNMLDEGVNLVNCRVGIYATLNSSERMIIQKLGRLLRHPSPILIIPYYKNTRDEEIVNKMLENYNPELVSTITDTSKLNIN